MEYKFSGKLNFDDYVQFQKAYLKSIIFKKGMVVIFALLVVIITFCQVIITKEGYLKKLLPFMIIGFGLIFIGIFLATIYSKKMYQKPFESNKLLKERSNFIIADDKIIISSESDNSILTKDKIYKIVFDKDSIYIFLAQNMARIIKRRFIGNELKYNELVLFIKDKYKENTNGK